MTGQFFSRKKDQTVGGGWRGVRGGFGKRPHCFRVFFPDPFPYLIRHCTVLNVFEFCYINYCVGFLKHFSVGKINLLGQIMTKHTSGSIAFKIMGFDSNIIWWADLPAFAFDICMQRWRRRPGWPWQGQGASEVHKTQLVNSLADAPSTTQQCNAVQATREQLDWEPPVVQR